MTNMSIQPLWLTHFIEILLVLEFQLTKFIVGMFSYKAHIRPQISSNGINMMSSANVVNHAKDYGSSQPNLGKEPAPPKKPFMLIRLNIYLEFLRDS